MDDLRVDLPSTFLKKFRGSITQILQLQILIGLDQTASDVTEVFRTARYVSSLKGYTSIWHVAALPAADLLKH